MIAYAREWIGLRRSDSRLDALVGSPQSTEVPGDPGAGNPSVLRGRVREDPSGAEVAAQEVGAAEQFVAHGVAEQW